MAPTTSLDPDEIRKQATRHEEFANQISGQLDILKGEVQSVLNTSSSEATKALNISTETWIESVRKSVLSHMNAMAQKIRTEAGDQETMDQETMNQIMGVELETGIFLSGGK